MSKQPTIAEYDRSEEIIRIHFPYDKAMVAKVKTLYKRAYSKLPQPHWTAPFSIRTVQQLREWDFELGAELQKRMGQTEIARTADEVAEHLVIDGLGGDLYPFQHDGVAFIESRGGRAMVADEMGLGKTMQALAYLQLHEGLRPAVIICPAVVKENWRREAEKWMPGVITHVISGRPTGQPLPPADLYIINYDIVAEQIAKPCPACKGKGSIKWAGDKKTCPACKGTGDDPDKKKIIFRRDITDANPKAAVLDECHFVKNRNAQRTKAVLELRKWVDHRIALSGTPIVNKPVEFFNALRFIAPERFTSFWNFAQEYCGAVHNGYGWDFGGASNTKGLHDLLTSTIMIRRTKAEVLKDLPAKVRSVIPIPMTDRRSYNAEEEALGKDLARDEYSESKGGAEALVRIEKLKQEAVRQKLPSAVQWIRDHLENEGKLVVFATHQFVVDELMQELGEYNPVAIDGRTPQKRRQGIVDRFQTDDDCRVFVGNIKAAGVGITLTAASATCFVELGWTPGEMEQAEDRIHRIGQEADSVMAYYLVAERTIEEEIAELLDSKRRILTEILDGKDVQDEDLLTELLRRMRR